MTDSFAVYVHREARSQERGHRKHLDIQKDDDSSRERRETSERPTDHLHIEKSLWEAARSLSNEFTSGGASRKTLRVESI